MALSLRIVASLLAIAVGNVHGCSNLLVSPGATADGSSILSYNSDDMTLFGSVDLRLAATHPPGSLVYGWDWDAQIFLGTFPDVNQTYNVVGNVNEYGVIITETTFGGRSDLDGGGIPGNNVSYGQLIWTTLQRSKTAREAITIMDFLCQNYGYASSGESFGVGDSNEVWLMELIGKGKYGKGAVWVASRVPDGYIGATANQARTQIFNQTDPENVLFSPDVISFARSIGAYNGTDADFNFREAYDPISFSGCRFAEARVWNLLNPACAGCLDNNLDFAQGYNLSNSMPLFVPAAWKLTLNDTITLMRTHFENTWFDNRGLTRPDVGAESGNSPYRARPLVWNYNSSNYLNERTVGVQQSGWAFIAQSRSTLPDPIKGIMWFAPDDSSTSPRIPLYGSATRIPAAFGSRVGQIPGGGVPYAPIADGFTMSLDSAFWVWNLVGNIAFSERYGNAVPTVIAEADAAQLRMIQSAATMEQEFVSMYATDPAGAIEYMTSYVEETGQNMMNEWYNFWQFLFATYRDGGVLSPSTATQCAPGQFYNCTAKLQPVDNEIGYTMEWRGRIVSDSDNAQRYLVPSSSSPEMKERESIKQAIVTGKRKGQERMRQAKLQHNQ